MEYGEKLKRDLKAYEGFKPCVYRCPANKLTVGFGHNIESKPLRINGVLLDKSYIIDDKPVITQIEASEVLDNDIIDARDGAYRLFKSFYSFPDCVQYTIVSMIFQMGQPTVMHFRNMCKAVEAGNWKTACYEALNSKWHLKDSPERSLNVAFNFLDAID